MAEVLENLFTDIANSIREKTGTADQMIPTEFASRISKIPTGGGGGQTIMVNADYAQNDPTQPDYIKNRPFYEGSASEYVEIAPSTVFTFVYFPGETGPSVIDAHYTTIPYSDEIHSILTSDLDKVKIVWDGTEYICIPYYKDGSIYVGNFGRLNPELATDTEEPFLIIYDYVDKTNVIIADLVTSVSVQTIDHTIAVSVLPSIIKKLDSKFIDFAPIAEYIDNYISEALGGDY